MSVVLRRISTTSHELTVISAYNVLKSVCVLSLYFSSPLNFVQFVLIRSELLLLFFFVNQNSKKRNTETETYSCFDRTLKARVVVPLLT